MYSIARRICVILLFCVLLAAGVQAAVITPSSEQITLSEGAQTFTLELRLTEETAFAGAEFGIDLPEGMSLSKVEYLDDAIRSASHTPEVIRENRVYFGFFQGNNAFQGAYAVARLTFTYTGAEDAVLSLGSSKIVTLQSDGTTTGDTGSKPFQVAITREHSSSSGSTTQTTTNPDGSTTTTVTRPDGSKTETTKAPDGSSSVVNTDKDGHVEASVTVSSRAVEDAEGIVELPMTEIAVTDDPDKAAEITVDLPANTTATVEIPVEDATAGTVAVIVKDDGAEEIIKTSFATENGVVVEVSDGDTVKIVDNSKDFADVPSSFWGADAVDFATSHELFNGTGKDTFSPNADMNRAMIVTVLARLEGVDTAKGSTWYEAGQQWAMEQGISDGSNMMGSLTREQLAAMLYRYVGTPAVSGSITGFGDTASVSGWASDAMTWAVQNGIISGSNGKLNPQSEATRTEVAAMLMRFIEKAA